MDSGLVNSSQTELKLNIHCIDKYSILLIPLTNLFACSTESITHFKGYSYCWFPKYNII